VGEHDYIGTFDMTVRSMLNPKSKFRVINEEKLTASLKPGGEKYKHSGTVTFKVAQHFTMIHDVDREADIALVKHRRAYKEAEMNPTKRKAFLSYMAGGHALVKAQALLRMATGMNSHKSAEELLDETNRARQQKQQQEVLQTQGLQRMQTNLDLFKKAAAVDETISLSVRGESLAAMDLFSSDPYLEFHKFNRSTGAFEKCAGSEVVKNTLNPKWPPILLASRDLITDTGNPLDTKVNVLQVKCFDWNSDGSVDYMGEFRTSYPEIRKCKETKFDLVWTDPANPTKTKIKGQIVFESCKVGTERHVDQVRGRGGCCGLHVLTFCFGMDFVFVDTQAVQMKVEKREVSQSATLMDHGEKEKKKKRQTLKRVATLSKASLQ
jgi:hypothetical protein